MALLLLVSCPAAAAPAAPRLTPVEAKARMEAASAEILDLNSNICMTLVQLQRLPHSEDPQAQFQQFSLQLTNLEQQVELISKRARAMKQRGDAYFADWEARIRVIRDPERWRTAQSRYNARKESYHRLVQNLQIAKANCVPLLAHLRQIQQLLRYSRDPVGLAAAKDQFMRATWRCLDVQRSSTAATAELIFLAGDFAQYETE